MPRLFQKVGCTAFCDFETQFQSTNFMGIAKRRFDTVTVIFCFFSFRPWSNNTLWIFVSPLCVRVSHSSIFGGYTFWNIARKSQTAIATVQGSKQHCRLSLLFSEFSIRYLYNLPQHARSELSFRQYKLHNYGHFSPLKDERYIQNDLFRSL